MQAFLFRRARQFVETHRGAVLYSAQGDCTGAQVRFNIQGLAGGRRIFRSGNTGVELLVQRAWVYGFDGDRPLCFPVWREPLHIPSTGSWYYFAAMIAHFPLLRSLKNTGLVLSHYSFDRAGFASITRLLELHHPTA